MLVMAVLFLAQPMVGLSQQQQMLQIVVLPAVATSLHLTAVAVVVAWA
jgi:hypothetical protein